MEVDREQTEDTMVEYGEGQREEQRPLFQAEDALTHETTIQRQKLLSDVSTLKKQEQEQEE